MSDGITDAGRGGPGREIYCFDCKFLLDDQCRQFKGQTSPEDSCRWGEPK